VSVEPRRASRFKVGSNECKTDVAEVSLRETQTGNNDHMPDGDDHPLEVDVNASQNAQETVLFALVVILVHSAGRIQAVVSYFSSAKGAATFLTVIAAVNMPHGKRSQEGGVCKPRKGK
jgi:hypothetical protein